MAKRKFKKIIWLVVVSLLAIGGIVGGIAGHKYYNGFVVSNIDTDGEDVFILISKNSSTEEVLNQLLKLGVVKDSTSLAWMMAQKNYQGKNIISGKYKISDGMTNNELCNHLRAGNGRLDVHITINQVRNIASLSGQLTKQLLLDSAVVNRWLLNPDSISRYGFNKFTIISMFIPNTYFIDLDVTAPELMQRMGQEYKKFWNEERVAKARNMGLSQSDVATLASIVYWETKMPEDMPIVAGVYVNRLRIGMALQADPTLLYAIGDYSIKRVLDVHKDIESPFNTYKYAGLPPGPILIPPVSYIDAVLNYTKHDYLYFVAKEDFSGYSYFAKTYSQHLAYARLYQRALNKKRVYR